MKSVNFQKKFEADLRKKYLPDLETEAGLVGLVGVQYDRVIVKVDSTKESKKTVYEHNGTTWVYVNKVENIEHEITFTDDHNIYITDKDRKPKLMGDVLPYEDIDDLLDKDPAIYNKLYITKKGKLYYYNSDGAYKLVSGGGGAGGTNRLTDVATFAEIATTYPKPDDYSAVVVKVDETHDGQKTWHVFEENVWNYQGIYFPETLEIKISLANTRALDIIAEEEYTLPLEYLVGKGHLEVYLDGELLVKDVDYTEIGTPSYMSTKIKFKNTIPIESRLMFKRVVSSYIGDSMISRMSKESWLTYMDEAYEDLDNKILNSSLKIVSAILGKPISGFIQDQTSITKDNLYIDKPTNNIYIARIDKTGTWSTVNTTDFKIHDLLHVDKKAYKAKVTFEIVHATGAITVTDSFNINTVVRTADGKYRVTYKVPLDAASNTFSLTHRIDWDSNENAYNVRIARGYVPNINYVDIVCGYYAFGTTPINQYSDTNMISLVVF